jgi:hypothetical protein
MFNRAKNTVIERSQFTTVQGDAHFHTGDPSNRGTYRFFFFFFRA